MTIQTIESANSLQTTKKCIRFAWPVSSVYNAVKELQKSFIYEQNFYTKPQIVTNTTTIGIKPQKQETPKI